MAYPFEKLDVAVVPRYWGTMEHPGLPGHGAAARVHCAQRARCTEEALLRQHRHPRAGALLVRRLRHRRLVGRHLAQRGGSPPGSTPRSPPSSSRAGRYDLERITRFERPMLADALDTAKPIRRSVTNAGDLEDAMDNDSTYFKGQSVFTMFEAWLTPPKTQQIVQRYLAAHARKERDLGRSVQGVRRGRAGRRQGAAHLRGAAGDPAGDGDHPLRRRQGNAHPRAATASTRPARTWRTRAGTCPCACATAPITRRSRTRRTARDCGRCTLLTESRQTVPLDACPTWLEPNADGLGYYHAAYTRVAFHHGVRARQRRREDRPPPRRQCAGGERRTPRSATCFRA